MRELLLSGGLAFSGACRNGRFLIPDNRVRRGPHTPSLYYSKGLVRQESMFGGHIMREHLLSDWLASSTACGDGKFLIPGNRVRCGPHTPLLYYNKGFVRQESMFGGHIMRELLLSGRLASNGACRNGRFLIPGNRVRRGPHTPSLYYSKGLVRQESMFGGHIMSEHLLSDWLAFSSACGDENFRSSVIRVPYPME